MSEKSPDICPPLLPMAVMMPGPLWDKLSPRVPLSGVWVVGGAARRHLLPLRYSDIDLIVPLGCNLVSLLEDVPSETTYFGGLRLRAGTAINPLRKDIDIWEDDINLYLPGVPIDAWRVAVNLGTGHMIFGLGALAAFNNRTFDFHPGPEPAGRLASPSRLAYAIGKFAGVSGFTPGPGVQKWCNLTPSEEAA